MECTILPTWAAAHPSNRRYSTCTAACAHHSLQAITSTPEYYTFAFSNAAEWTLDADIFYALVASSSSAAASVNWWDVAPDCAVLANAGFSLYNGFFTGDAGANWLPTWGLAPAFRLQ